MYESHKKISKTKANKEMVFSANVLPCTKFRPASVNPAGSPLNSFNFCQISFINFRASSPQELIVSIATAQKREKKRKILRGVVLMFSLRVKRENVQFKSECDILRYRHFSNTEFRKNMEIFKSEESNGVVDRLPETQTETTIVHLIEDCLLHMMEYLDLVDLVNFAETCINIRIVAEWIYRKHSHLTLSERLFEKRTLDESTVERLFSHVGKYLSSLSINLYDCEIDVYRIIWNKCHNIQYFKYKTRGFDHDEHMFQCNQNGVLFGKLKSIEVSSCHITNSSIFSSTILESLTLIDCKVDLNIILEEENVLEKLTLIKCKGSGVLPLANSTKYLKELVYYLRCDLPSYDTIKNIESLDVDVYEYVDVQRGRLKSIFRLKRLRILRLIFHAQMDSTLFWQELTQKECLLEELHVFKLVITSDIISVLSSMKKLKILNLQYPIHTNGDEFLKQIAQILPELRQFCFVESHSITGNGIVSFFKSMEMIEKLNFSKCNVTATALREIEDVIKLKPHRKLELTVSTVEHHNGVFEEPTLITIQWENKDHLCNFLKMKPYYDDIFGENNDDSDIDVYTIAGSDGNDTSSCSSNVSFDYQDFIHNIL